MPGLRADEKETMQPDSFPANSAIELPAASYLPIPVQGVATGNGKVRLYRFLLCINMIPPITANSAVHGGRLIPVIILHGEGFCAVSAGSAVALKLSR